MIANLIAYVLIQSSEEIYFIKSTKRQSMPLMKETHSHKMIIDTAAEKKNILMKSKPIAIFSGLTEKIDNE